MYRHDDPKVIENTRKMNKYYKNNPHRTWRYNLSPERIKELEDKFPELKKVKHYEEGVVKEEEEGKPKKYTSGLDLWEDIKAGKAMADITEYVAVLKRAAKAREDAEKEQANNDELAQNQGEKERTGMFTHDDPKVKENTRKMTEYYKANPHRTWRTNLSPERIKELEDKFPELKKAK